MKTLTKFKIQQSAVKVYIFGSGLLFAAYCGVLCLGMRHALAEWLGMSFAYVLLCGAAWMYKLCWLSWAFIAYTYIVRCCIICHRLGWFGEYIDLAHYITFSIGAVLSFIFLFNIKKFLNTNYYETESTNDSEDAA